MAEELQGKSGRDGEAGSATRKQSKGPSDSLAHWLGMTTQ